MSQLSGYKGLARRILESIGAEIGDRVRITRAGFVYEGILMPRSEYGDDKHVLIKLDNGYNVGVRVDEKTSVEVVGKGAKPSYKIEEPPSLPGELPTVALVSTGGTIASRVDYRTGAVRPALSASELYGVVPELAEIARIETEILYNIFSENMTPQHWASIASCVGKWIEKGVKGVVIAHGTDTMAYTAAALSFALRNLPVPVVLVGAQRSSDRPSSDAALNLIGAVTAAAKGSFAEVCVAMHKSISDTEVVLHRGTRVRKCHTSRRDAFKSVNSKPLGVVREGKVIMLEDDYQERDESKKLELKASFSDKATLLKFYPGMDSRIIDVLVELGFKGIILEGTGLGHVGESCFDAIKRAVEGGVFVGMTSQCIWGRVNMNVYSTGRELQNLGVVPLDDMLPEVALVKLMWVLAQTEDPERIKEMMLTPFAYEIGGRTVYEHGL